jgi:hypothetical protein
MLLEMTKSVELTLNGTLTPDQTLTYIHIPFEVPEGIERIDVAYTYDAAIASDPHLSGGNTIDIGIFDTRGVNFLSAGFRGWSGSARSEFTVGTKQATPGYMPGPIFAGTWHICLGAYKVAPNGCHYQVAISLRSGNNDAVIEFPERLPLDYTKTAAIKPDGWYRGEIHCHTVNSDGDSTVAEIVAQAEALGLDFLAITDHNNLTHQIDLNRLQSKTPLLLIPGCEVTTYFGHWNVWGEGRWVDFRIQQPTDLERAIDFAKQQGYLVSCNHPRPQGPDWAFPEVKGYACVEVWNGPWALNNTRCLDFWETQLKQGKRLTAVGGSDHHFSHRPHIAQLAHPTMVVYVPTDLPPTAARILDAIRAGHCFVTESPSGAHLTLRSGAAMMGDTLPHPLKDRISLEIGVTNGTGSRLELIGQDGLLSQVDIGQDNVHLVLELALGDSHYVRAQLVDPENQHVRALTNPIYFE